MNASFLTAITQIAEEKNLPREIILDAVEAALAAADKKDYGDKDQEVRVKLAEDTGEIQVYLSRAVVADDTTEEDFNPLLQIHLKDAKRWIRTPR